MKWFMNLKIRTKLIISFSIVVIFVILLGVFGCINSISSNDRNNYVIQFPQTRMKTLTTISSDFKEMRRIGLAIAYYSGDTEKINGFKKSFDNAHKDIGDKISAYTNLVNTDSNIDAESKKIRTDGINNVDTKVNWYKSEVIEPLIKAALANDQVAVSEIVSGGASVGDELDATLSVLIDEANTLTTTIVAEINKEIYDSIKIVIIVISLIVILSIAIAMFIASTISKPINEILDISTAISHGNTRINIRKRDTKDEVGELFRSFSTVTSVINNIIDAMETLADRHDKGEIDDRIDENAYEGSFKSVAIAVNNLVEGHINTKIKAMDCIREIVNGDFNAPMEKLPGKKVFINEAIEAMRTNVKSINTEVVELTKSTLAGDLSKMIDVSKYPGDWSSLMKGLNDVLATIEEPIVEITDVMQKISNGDFSTNIVGDYKGEFLVLKNSVNSTVKNMSEYITEISQTLSELANNNLNQEIKRDYVGDFSNIKNALNNIISKLNEVIENISSASEQVSTGSKQVSDSSMKLAEGASEQASSVEELTTTIDTINQQTLGNAENSKTANSLSEVSKQNAIKGNDEMKRMLVSMTGIKDSSNNISKIIKTIEDIAFQTNLLALNAAVEAARAGQHGKGFAVVAEEVRSLASRSQTAAKETNDLINDSIAKVDEGTIIATNTARSLDTIVQDVEQVSKIISEIADSSAEQANAISHVSIGLNQISKVVQSNSATSQESASASEELASQSDVLKNMISVFSLKNAHYISR